MAARVIVSIPERRMFVEDYLISELRQIEMRVRARVRAEKID